jgi:hypothetical protein
VAIWHPPSFRGFYRVAMAVSFCIGQVMGKVLLGAVYLLIVTPLGLLMRALGKDPLDIRHGKGKQTYWKPARRTGKFEQQF